MGEISRIRAAAAGTAAGLGGSVLLQQVSGLGQRLGLPHAPIRQDPGEFLVRRARTKLASGPSREAQPPVPGALSKSLALGYGAAFGALYAALRPRGGHLLPEGAALGAVAWAAGYLGWLPAAGFMPPVHRQRPGEVVMPLLEHIAFGVATLAAFEGLRRLLR